MLDEKLNSLICKYGIYDVIGGVLDSAEPKSFLGKLGRYVKWATGGIRLMWALNVALDKVNKNEKIALWFVDAGRSYLRAWMYLLMLLPRNRKKICFLIRNDKTFIRNQYHGLIVLGADQIPQYSIGGIILTLGAMERHMGLIGRNYPGHIIDMNLLITEYHLEKYFSGMMKSHPYTDIFISHFFLKHSSKKNEREVWHKRLIANYLRARDFLNVQKQIEDYNNNGYKDASSYCAFWNEIEILLDDIKKQIRLRKNRDIFVYWIDCTEKEDFFSMKWVGNKNVGIIFHRAYTTMAKTTMTLRSIFTGKSVKEGKLRDVKKLELDDTVFAGYPLRNYEIHAYSGYWGGKLGDSILHEVSRYYAPDVPSMVLIWNMLDTLLSSSSTCVNFVHCMETHPDYRCGELCQWTLGFPDGMTIPFNHLMDCTELARISSNYLDKQLEWYHRFSPLNSINIYMSDHGCGEDLAEEFVNVPFKITGNCIMSGNEYRLFSYKNFNKLINNLIQSGEILEDIFSDYVIIDMIDPYEKSHSIIMREEAIIHHVIERKNFDREFLKRLIQTTKIVTEQEEYYTINILGEEKYYRDKECKIDLADNPMYAERIKELREKAGKFYNPWKEKRQVAIDFYEYLGIKEEDIVAQCY